MGKRYYFYLYLLSIVLNLLVGLLIREPGYMDAEYYYAGAIRIADGTGGSEPYIWNYLSSPQELPTPSFAYWMPLTSIVSSVGMILSGSRGFFSAKIAIILVSGLIPVITAKLASIYLGDAPGAKLAGVLSILSAFYIPYISNTDSFTLYIVLGGFLLLILDRTQKKGNGWWKYLVLGAIAGLLHLCRADGLLVFLFLASIITFSIAKKIIQKKVTREDLFSPVFLVVGYLIVMSPWYFRNLSVFHSLMPPGNSRLLWSTTYNDIFTANPEKLTFARFIDNGINKILIDRLKALWMNIKSILAVNGGIFLTPLIMVGFWKTRKCLLTCITGTLILLNLITMSFLFPYAGYRGGFFHSNSLMQTAIWALVPVGLTGFINLGIKLRNWKFSQAWNIFSLSIIVGLLCLSILLIYPGITTGKKLDIVWNGTLGNFQELDRAIIDKTGDESSNIMVNDPPGYYLATSRNAVVTPIDGITSVMEIANRFHVRFLILDENNIEINNEISTLGFSEEQAKFLMEINGKRVYEFTQE